ncbi:MAG: hypothetical protein KBA61_14980 [Spirochaetes bacterium]|nr:hypothetical protein [Spirochaetota bacterium]HPA70727.1 hypothetical protein [Spirochaetota bacterium]
MEDSIIILKARFKSNSLSLYGILLVIYNRNQDLDSYNAVVSTYSSIYDIEPHVGWEMFEESILDIKWKGSFNNSMTSSLMDNINAIAKDENLKTQLYEYLNNYDYDNAEVLIYDAINRIIHDKNLVIEIGIQEVTPDEFKETKEKRSKAQVPGDKSPVEDGSAILPVEPILSPVKGKPLYELKIGDKIMARIVPNSDRANYFIDLMDLRTDGGLKPIPCEIIDIKSGGKNAPVDILMQIGPGIYGKCSESEKQVKLRIYDPLTDGPQVTKVDGKKVLKKTPVAETQPGKGMSTSSYIIIGLFVIILIIFILLLFLSFS